MPQVYTAHDTLWDLAACPPETAHMVLRAMTDWVIPRSHRMMQGEAIHFINEIFKHCKLLGATGEDIQLIKASDLPDINFADLGLKKKLFVIKAW